MYFIQKMESISNLTELLLEKPKSLPQQRHATAQRQSAQKQQRLTKKIVSPVQNNSWVRETVESAATNNTNVVNSNVVNEEEEKPRKNLKDFFGKFGKRNPADINNEDSLDQKPSVFTKERKTKVMYTSIILLIAIITCIYLFANKPSYLFSETEHTEDKEVDTYIFIRILFSSLIVGGLVAAGVFIVRDSKTKLENYQNKMPF